ncbi:hypothetical protein BSK56_04030 [Paenibacillus borealis]|uniref:Beta-lactamase-related domain-containing protein n=1 Tax=Paenibacillus borealis TaxID=160799 RepID=A0ABX3HNT3_PAEBO|nr:hypothetical protein BSK56_04030 [Paenibacillus borealis]
MLRVGSLYTVGFRHDRAELHLPHVHTHGAFSNGIALLVQQTGDLRTSITLFMLGKMILDSLHDRCFAEFP